MKEWHSKTKASEFATIINLARTAKLNRDGKVPLYYCTDQKFVAGQAKKLGMPLEEFVNIWQMSEEPVKREGAFWTFTWTNPFHDLSVEALRHPFKAFEFSAKSS